MDQILHKVHNVDPNNSDAVKESLSLFFHKLPEYNDSICNKWLREMRAVIDRFPKYCMSHRSNIEKYLIGLFSSQDYNSVIEVAKCAHALQQVRPTNEKMATPKSNWRDQMSFLCFGAHTLISAIFPNAVDIYKDITELNTVTAKTPMSEFLTDITKMVNFVNDKQTILQTRLKNLFVFIQAMLVETYPVGKPIRPQTILDVIVRALSVTSGSNQDANVASIKIQALRTLDALIMCLGSNLIPFSPLIFRFVMQTLRWSSDNQNEANRDVRVTAYNTLTSWLYTLYTHKTSNNSSLEDELSTHILDDVTPSKKVVQLTIGPQPTKHLSKKAKRKLANTQLLESTISAHMPGEKNKVSVTEEENNEVAIAALECAEAFLTVCGRFLKPNTHKLFQEHIVRECFNNSYKEDHLICLLRVLEALRKTTPNNVPPPTQYCLQVYSTLVNMRNAEISKFCSQAVLDIRLQLHCSPPSINFAIEVPQTEKPKTKQKQVSKRNRATLELLLGKDKIPSETAEEVITIPDEPSIKKQRLEESDKISLSSDDIDPSVEISDDSEDNIQSEHKSDDDLVIDEDIELNDDAKVQLLTDEQDEVQSVNEDEGINEVDSINEDELIKEVENINEMEAENINVVDKIEEKVSIYEAVTQIPLNTSSDNIEDRLSLEVGYDYPNTGTEKVAILEKIDDEILPSTNDTDDVQITCGQIVKNTENDENKLDNEEPKTNGIDIQEIVENGEVSKDEINLEATKEMKTGGVSVEDMLADFVDEVNEEAVLA